MLHLDGQGDYVTDGDVVLATFFLYDDADNVYKPQLVRSGMFQLMHQGVMLFQRGFDARFGNSDGQFHIDVAHPSVTTDLQLSVSVTLFDASVLSFVRPLHVTPSELQPLAQQPEVDTQGYGTVRG